MAKRFTFIAALAALVLSAACGVHQADTPTLSGPSELALAIGVSVTPDSISQDGASQSAVTVTAHDANGKALSGLAVKVEIQAGGVPMDYGTLSTKNIVTGSDGKATTVYTAPAPPPPNQVTSLAPACPGATGTCVQIVATATGSNFQTALPVTANLRLVPPGVILPPATTPVPQFSWTPQPINFNIPVTFDASLSCGGPMTAGVCQYPITSYAWNFGDGATGSGKTATHTFAQSTGTSYAVTLTVTNDRGVAASLTQTVSVSPSAAPTGDFVWSPQDPIVGQAIVFNADSVRPATGRTIVKWSWIWGDGTSDGTTGFLVQHTYTVAAKYNVTLTVMDDVGQKTTITHQIGVGSGAPTPVITFSPTSIGVGTTVNFSSASTTTVGGATISSYSWLFGDGSSATSANPTHAYAKTGTYTVTLTVTDSAGRTGTTTATITVS